MRKSEAGQLSLREEQKLFTRRRIVDAALKVFEETGFRAASIDQIAKRAGANRSTFYLHFKSKADLGQAMALTLEVVDQLDLFDERRGRLQVGAAGVARRAVRVLRRGVLEAQAEEGIAGDRDRLGASQKDSENGSVVVGQPQTGAV